MQIKSKMDAFIIFIIIIKVVFVISALAHVYLTHFGTSENSKLDKKFTYWKERTEFVFIASMALILIIVFNPHQTQTPEIDTEMKLLLFLFGWVLIITAKWGIFFKESPLLKKIQSSLQ